MAEIIRDGLRLHYAQVGDGDEHVVLVPGWCCDHRVFAPLVDHFRTACTVTALDLRGCGASDRPDGGYDVPTLADDVAAVCDELAITDPVVVGHSLGGMIALELGARRPGLPAAIVALDPGPITATPEARQLFSGLADRLEGPDGAAVRAAYLRTHVLAGLDPEQAAEIAETMSSVPTVTAAAMLRGGVAWDGLAALVLCQAPLLVVLSKARGSNAPERLLAYRPDLEVGVTVGTGHFHHLEAPDQVIPMIERFLDSVDGRRRQEP